MDDRTEVLRKTRQLLQLYQSGKLGGSTMPEDSNPGFPRGSKENYTYFTLPMALNYQRNSYKLWEAAAATSSDPATADAFDMASAAGMPEQLLQEKLTRYNLALQRNKQPAIWQTLCPHLPRSLWGPGPEPVRGAGEKRETDQSLYERP